MKNNSYVCVPADKIIELIADTCPPSQDPLCFGKNDDYAVGQNCVACWYAWLKGGEQ